MLSISICQHHEGPNQAVYHKMSTIPETYENIGGTPFKDNTCIEKEVRSDSKTNEIDSPDPLSKFNGTCPVGNVPSSLFANPEESQASSVSPSPAQHASIIPDIASLSVSPDCKPPSIRFQRNQTRHMRVLSPQSRTTGNKSFKTGSKCKNLQNCEHKIDEVSRDENLGAKDKIPATVLHVDCQEYSESFKESVRRIHDEVKANDDPVAVIDVDCREECRSSKSRVKALQSLSKSRNSRNEVR